MVTSSAEKPIHLSLSARRWNALSSTRWEIIWRSRVLASFIRPGTNRFERAALRRSVSDEGGEFHLARYQTRCFKLSFEHQCSRVASDVADWKFNSARERDGVLIPSSPLCLRSLGRLPEVRSWIQQQESAFSGALSVKAQGAVLGKMKTFFRTLRSLLRFYLPGVGFEQNDFAKAD